MYTYCLFCRTLRCTSIRRFLEASTPHTYLQPRIVQRKWVKGEEQEALHDFLPGYLFVYTEEPIRDFEIFFRVGGVIRVLGYRGEDGLLMEHELDGEDRRFALALKQHGGLIDHVKVYRVGDRLTPARGLLADLTGTIVRVDRQRRRLEMEYSFDNTVRRVWVGYDVIEEGSEEAEQETLFLQQPEGQQERKDQE